MKFRATLQGGLTFQTHNKNLARDTPEAGIKENTQHKRKPGHRKCFSKK